ncbi:hypothetical protein GQ607_006869 [Colletotrichum asianum]|uniref:Uncharacterized protein n=1 Tax=Colletotrichum asianum TaxID=702518 RepID=A0A8H3ZTS3_9PEZI|nr:hypothetical protein GQ607_006869 [Colletotrichum asianum]
MEMVLFICALWKKSPWALDKGGNLQQVGSGLDWTGTQEGDSLHRRPFCPREPWQNVHRFIIQPTSMTQSRS